jgi:hypothetical protein
MSRLHAEEEQAREEAAMFRDELIGPLQAALGPDVRVLSSKLGGSWRYFTVPMQPRVGLTLKAHARELVRDLKTQMKAFDVKKVAQVALDVQCGTVDWPDDKRQTVRVSLWF